MTIVDQTRIGVAIPQVFTDANIDMDMVRRFVHRAEELGFSSLWTQERITGAPSALSPISFLAYVAGQTRNIRLGVSVVVLPRHNPIHLAKQTADIDQMSGGRLILGVGLGNNAKDLLQYGLSASHRVGLFTENVEIIRALWSRDWVEYQGKYNQLSGTNIAPKPLQGHIPIWFGANVEKAVRRAVRYADGWTGAGSASLEAFPRNVSLVQELLAADGRTQKDFPISKRIYLAIDDNEERALERLKHWSKSWYGTPDILERSAIWGDATKVQRQLSNLSGLGIDEFILNPVFDYEEHLERLAEITGLS